MIATSPPASAPQPPRQIYHLAAQSLAASLHAIALQSGRSIVAPAELLAGKVAPPLDGVFSAEEAVAAVIAGSGLRQRGVGGGIVIEAAPSRLGADEPAEPADSDIVVTGSRIRGAQVASPVIASDETAIRTTGQATLGEFARSLPQSFGGGQNPGVGFNVPAAGGANVGSGSSFNLRGLGSDATLTLLNGHRMPYTASAQSIDVSGIPLGAVQRVEIVADGASALYGSDAVAGVVNIILKPEFRGIETRARIGGSTEGGDFQQLYGAIAGSSWRNGGIYAAYEFDRSTRITSDQRDYGRTRPGVTLLPASRSHRALISGHQDIADDLVLKADAVYTNRSSSLIYPVNFAGNLAVSRTELFWVDSFAIAPSLDWSHGSWQLSLNGTFGKDSTRFRGDTYSGQTRTSSVPGRYRNQSKSVEVGGNGDLFRLPAGPVKLALGAGARLNDFRLFRGTGSLQNIAASQRSLFGYAEITVPLVSPEQDLSFLHRLTFSGAVRYESYRGIGDVATPKLGLVASPSAGFDIKASWGKSFRAPTFLQQYQLRQAVLYPAALFAGTNFPAGSSALLLLGGNPELKPERATGWSATVAIHPERWRGLRLELSYFNTRYVDRIVNPIPYLQQAFSDPVYQDYVVRNPTSEQQQAVLAAAGQFINATGASYDPSRVAAIVNGSNVNAGNQAIEGIDALLDYRTRLGDSSDALSLSFNASYLRSSQQLNPRQPRQPLAGMLFAPPHLRLRATAAYSTDTLTLGATVSHIGGVDDPRSSPARHISGMSTLDLSARYRPKIAAGPLRGVEFAVTAQNLLNAKPEVIATTLYSDTPYDSTNYSPVGRFLALEIVKKR